MNSRIYPISNNINNNNVSFGQVKYTNGAIRKILKTYANTPDIAKRTSFMSKLRGFDQGYLEKSPFKAILSKALLGGFVLTVVDKVQKKYAAKNKDFKINLDNEAPFEEAEKYVSFLEEDRKFFDHITEKVATGEDYKPGPIIEDLNEEYDEIIK